MVQPISVSQLQQYKKDINAGGVDAVAKVYDALYGKGHGYAGWAKGVAEGLPGMSVTGNSAVYFLQRSYHDNNCRFLSNEELDKIRVDMALKTLDKYIEIANRKNGILDREILFREMRDVHKEVFEENGTTLDNWTLELPMELIRQAHGDAAVEAHWQNIAKTGGTGTTAWDTSLRLYARVRAAAYSPSTDSETRKRAFSWLKNTPDPAWAYPKKLGFDIGVAAAEQVVCAFKRPFSQAKKYAPPRDPIVLDLDGNGLQTVGLSSNVYFDHDGDGVRTKTGWTGEGAALLVLDRNGNGKIDNGIELFSEFTPMPDGSLAPNGFAALAALDSNGDGVLDASDPAFAELKLWRDTSQDGQTDAGELLTLAEAGIKAINIGHTLKNQAQGNGNTLVREGSFVREDGSIGAMGEFHFAINATATRFVEEISISEETTQLPYVSGSGKVRDLWQAATQSPQVAKLLEQFKSALTRKEQEALTEELLTAWAATSGMAKTLEERAAGKYRVQYDALGNDRRAANLNLQELAATSGTVAAGTSLLTDAGGEHISESYRNLIADWSRKLHVLEAFNGEYFFNLPDENSQTPTANWGLSVAAGSSTGNSGSAADAVNALPTLHVNLAQAQLDLLQKAYASLAERVHSELVLQTRVIPYVGLIEVVIDEQGVRLNAEAFEQKLAERKASDVLQYVADVLYLHRYAGELLEAAGWQGLDQIADPIESLPKTERLQALLNEFYVLGTDGADDIRPDAASEGRIVLAGAGDDTVQGGAGRNYLYGQDGDDDIRGNSGDDRLSGGAGNDTVAGGAGSDTYVFARGDGHDVIREHSWQKDDIDRLQLVGMMPADVRVERVRNNPQQGWNDDLKITVRDTGETVTVERHFFEISHRNHAVEEVVFADGTVWDAEALKTHSLLGGAGNDVLRGFDARDDVMEGGAGDDTLEGGSGSDTYVFARGDGHDVIQESSWQKDDTDRLQLVGIMPADVRLERIRSGSRWYLNDDLKITIRDTGETITVKKHFDESNRHAIEEIVFADGTVWDVEAIKTHSLLGGAGNDSLRGFDDRDDVIEGGAGDDTLEGLSGNDSLVGGSGDDKLLGGAGDDTLKGGAGNDSMKGGAGSDTYRFGLGDGHDVVDEGDTDGEDVVELGAGIAPADVAIRWTMQGDMELTLPDGSTLNVLKQIYNNVSSRGVEQLRFADGTVWGYAEMAARALAATDGDDTVVGGFGDDTLEGGAGNDHFRNLGGYDTYRFGTGDGQDTVEATMGRILFKQGINQNDVHFSLDGDDLLATLGGSGDAVRLKNWLANPYLRIDRFDFDNGAGLSVRDVLSKLNVGENTEILYGSPGNDTIVGTEKHSTLYGREGDDALSGGDGNDALHGEDGDDTLEGGAGHDVLKGGAGHDVLKGGDGNDVLHGEDGDDTLEGGAGRDTLVGAGGNNTYLIGKGMDLDVAQFADAAVADDTVVLAAGIRPEDVSVQLGDKSFGTQAGNVGYSSLVIGIGGNDALVARALNGGDLGQSALKRLRFDDGTEWTLADLIARADGGKYGWQLRDRGEPKLLTGSQADDYIRDYTGESVTVQARGNDDSIELGSGNHTVSAGGGDDDIRVGTGNNLLAGEAGDDDIQSDAGDDVVVFNYGDGSDRLQTGDGVDTLSFGGGITPEMLSVACNAQKQVQILVDGGAGGSITLSETYIDNLPGDLERIQFIDAVGQARIFDWAGWLQAHANVLRQATAASPLAFDGSSFEISATAMPAGGLEAVAYAQTGNLFAQANIADNVPTDGDDTVYGTAQADVLDAGAGHDVVMGLAGNDTIRGGEGHDRIDGGDGDDVLDGGPGDDTIRGGWGADVLIGGAGRDKLFGQWGGDTYIYNVGHEEVVIDDDHRVLEQGRGDDWVAGSAEWDDSMGGYAHTGIDAEPNILQFGAGIRPEDLRYAEQDGDLVITFVNQPNDRVVLRGYEPGRATKTRSVDIIRFTDGGQEIVAAHISPTGVTQTISDMNNELHGSAFADVLIGSSGDDTLVGNGGADKLIGGAGYDTYRIHKAWGSPAVETLIAETWREQDTNRIELTGDIRAEDLYLELDNDELVLRLTPGGDTIRFAGFDPREAGMPAPVAEIILYDQNVALSFDELLARGVRYGGETDDVYTVNIGDGMVTIVDRATPEAGNIVRFGEGISPATLRNNLRFAADGEGGHFLLIPYGNEGDVLRLAGFNPQDVWGERAVERFEFADGTVVDYATLVGWTFVVEGDNSGNALTGTNAGDRLYGYDGDDVLSAGDGEDVLTGGRGDDVLRGGAGRDAYVVNLGDGRDVIEDGLDGTTGNVLSFGEGIGREDVRAVTDGDDLLIHYGSSGDSVRVKNHAPQGAFGGRVIDTLEFADGHTVALREWLNRAPEVAGSIPEQLVQKNTAFSLRLPDDLFTDADGDDVLIRVAASGYDTPPQWLQYDAATRTLYGQPQDADVGAFDVLVQGMDTLGASSLYSFRVTVEDTAAEKTNTAPQVGIALHDMHVMQDSAFSFTLPVGSFRDADAGDVLTYSARLADGRALPEWLHFDAVSGTFNGTPTQAGDYAVQVTATDREGAQAGQTFVLAVASAPAPDDGGSQKPVGMTPDDAVAAEHCKPQTITVQSNSGKAWLTPALADVRFAAGRALISGRVLVNGRAFGFATQTCSSTTPDGTIGRVGMRVTVSAAHGGRTLVPSASPMYFGGQRVTTAAVQNRFGGASALYSLGAAVGLSAGHSVMYPYAAGSQGSGQRYVRKAQIGHRAHAPSRFTDSAAGAFETAGDGAFNSGHLWFNHIDNGLDAHKAFKGVHAQAANNAHRAREGNIDVLVSAMATFAPAAVGQARWLQEGSSVSTPVVFAVDRR